MFEEARDLGNRLQALVDDLDPDCYDGPGALRMLDAFTRLENLAVYGKAAMARRVEYTRAWKRKGDASAAQFLARRTGTTVGQATATLKTARQLTDLGAVTEAAKAGELSSAETNEIAEACTADPNAEKELVAKAATGSFQELRETCGRVKAAARQDEVAHHDAIRKRRYLRTWTDSDGAGRGEWRMTPDAQARLLARLGLETDAVAAEAKAAGAPVESRPAYAADALVRLAETSNGERAVPPTVMHVRVDHAALRRGNTEPGEICEIEGVGSIPIATALAMSTEALAYAILTNGADITHIWRLDRTIPRALRIALQARDQVCIVPQCSVRDHLQIHHIHAVTDGGATSETNCCRPCQWHHYLCTHHGWRIQRVDGEWQFLPPAGRDRSPPDELPLAV